MSDAGAAPMSREGVDHALETLRDERERISAGLLDLEDHDGYRLLKGARLAGETFRRWEETRGRIASLWKLYDAYAAVLERAEELRARHPRPGPAVLAELSGMLSGASVELTADPSAQQRRTLLGPEAERLALGEVVARMSAAYDRVTEEVGAADAAWSALLTPLGEAEEAWRQVRALSRELALANPDLDRIGRELVDARRIVQADPLSFVHEGTVDTRRLDAVLAELTAQRTTLSQALRVRDGYDERVRRIEDGIEQVGALLAEAVRARDVVLVKIASPGLPEIPDTPRSLRDRLGGLDALRRAARWSDLASRTVQLEEAVTTAVEQAQGTLGIITGLLDRRDELRGRLEAYQAKAARIGGAEDADLARLHAMAREILWTAPCDLRQATAVLAQYQQAIRSLESGTDT